MLPKKEKFTSTDFSKLKYIKTKKIHTNIGFFVIILPQTPGSMSTLTRVSVVLPKKIFKTAVNRNKYKRLFYNTLLSLKKVDNKVNKLSLVFYPKREYTQQELEEAFREILK